MTVPTKEKYSEIFDRCKALIQEVRAPIIVIDGRAASGKSTFARTIADLINGTVVHADDFFLPFDMRTTERLSEIGGNFHYERFAAEVISNLRAETPFKYGVFNCGKGVIDSYRTLDPSRPIVIEGAYSMSPRFGKYYDLAIFMTASLERRLERIKERDGIAMVEMFRERWIPLEEAYIASCGTERLADFIVDTTDI